MLVGATRTPLAFAQLQNAVRALALDRALDFYFWGHADIVLVGPAQARGPVEQLGPCMDIRALTCSASGRHAQAAAADTMPVVLVKKAEKHVLLNSPWRYTGSCRANGLHSTLLPAPY